MTRMEAERAAYAANGDKELRTRGQWIAQPGPTLLEGWSLGLILPNGKIVSGGDDAQGRVCTGAWRSPSLG